MQQFHYTVLVIVVCLINSVQKKNKFNILNEQF